MSAFTPTQDALMRKISETMVGAKYDDILAAVPVIVAYAISSKVGTERDPCIDAVSDLTTKVVALLAMVPAGKDLDGDTWVHFDPETDAPRPASNHTNYTC